ncbi:hypothetical protein HF878_03200 [Selenomonas bovis]|uniref:Uncharacterized protein n=1 Tax=Selenomonas bovis TaxID=416586 RepID=A0A848BBR4_9FIRM|nr:hypothetical protein [Selenomonas bovis]
MMTAAVTDLIFEAQRRSSCLSARVSCRQVYKRTQGIDDALEAVRQGPPFRVNAGNGIAWLLSGIAASRLPFSGKR